MQNKADETPKLSLNEYLFEVKKSKFSNMHRVAEMKNDHILKEIVTDWGAVTLEEVKNRLMSNAQLHDNKEKKNHFTFQQRVGMVNNKPDENILNLQQVSPIAVNKRKDVKRVQNMKNRLSDQKTKFLMTKYLPIQPKHKRVPSQQIVEHKKQDDEQELRDTLNKSKKIKPTSVYYLNPRSKSLIPSIPAAEYRRRMGVDLENINNNEIKVDAEHLDQKLGWKQK